MFKFLIASFFLATSSYAIDCNDDFDVDSESTFLKDGLAVYSSDYQARIYNLSTSECIVSFEGSIIDYPIIELIFTLYAIQGVQEDKWINLPGKVAIDYLKQDGHLDYAGTDKVCDTKSKTYHMSTVGIVNCPLILKLHKEHDSHQSMVEVVVITICFYVIIVFLCCCAYSCAQACFFPEQLETRHTQTRSLEEVDEPRETSRRRRRRQRRVEEEAAEPEVLQDKKEIPQ